jgi:hypothetical protein
MPFVVTFPDGRFENRFDNAPRAGDEGASFAEVPRPVEIYERLTAGGNIALKDAATVKNCLIEQVNARRRALVGAAMTSGDPIIDAEHQAKKQEVLDRTGPWPWLEAEAAATGRTVAQIRVEVKAQIAAQEAGAIAAAALTRAAREAIRAAPTAAGALAAFKAIAWPPSSASV